MASLENLRDRLFARGQDRIKAQTQRHRINLEDLEPFNCLDELIDNNFQERLDYGNLFWSDRNSDTYNALEKETKEQTFRAVSRQFLDAYPQIEEDLEMTQRQNAEGEKAQCIVFAVIPAQYLVFAKMGNQLWALQTRLQCTKNAIDYLQDREQNLARRRKRKPTTDIRYSVYTASNDIITLASSEKFQQAMSTRDLYNFYNNDSPEDYIASEVANINEVGTNYLAFQSYLAQIPTHTTSTPSSQ